MMNPTQNLIPIVQGRGKAHINNITAYPQRRAIMLLCVDVQAHLDHRKEKK